MNIERYHAITLTFIGQTDTKPARVRVYSERFKHAFYCSGYKDGAIKELQARGFVIAGDAELSNQSKYLLLSTTFEPFK